MDIPAAAATFSFGHFGASMWMTEDGSDDGRVEALVRPKLLADVLGHDAGQDADGARGQQEHVAHVRPVLAHLGRVAHTLPENFKEGNCSTELKKPSSV